MSAIVRSQSARKRFCSSSEGNVRALRALFLTYFTPAMARVDLIVRHSQACDQKRLDWTKRVIERVYHAIEDEVFYPVPLLSSSMSELASVIVS